MTSKIKKILVPIDFTETSEAAILQGVEIAKLLKAEVYLLHVIPSNGHSVLETSPAQVLHQDGGSMKVKMDNFQKDILQKHGITVEAFIISGNVVDKIIEFAKNQNIDQIIMGTHGASGYRELFIGSNAQRVVTLSEVPVITMLNRLNESSFKNILIPIDNAIHSREKVDITLEIAKIFNAKVHILGLIDSNEILDINKMKIKLESIEKHVNKDHLSFVTTIEHGDSIAKTAVDYANKHKCDLIAINTGHESRITGIFLGPFAQQIVNHSNIPVLSVKQHEGKFTTSTF